MENYIEYLYQEAKEKKEDFVDRVNDFIRYKNIVTIQFVEYEESYFMNCIVIWKKEIS